MSMLFLAFLVFVFTVDFVQAGCSKPCPLNWIPFGGHCYQLVLEKLTWHDAENYCQKLPRGRFGPSHLVSVLSAEENQFVLDIIHASQAIAFTDHVWLGLSDLSRENDFVWVDGSGRDDQFDNWAVNQPDDSGGADCGLLKQGYGWKWDDGGCSRDEFHFICKMKQM